MARECGWSALVVEDADVVGGIHGLKACVVDAREGVVARHLTGLPRHLPCIAVIDANGVRAAAGLLELGVTHFVPWPGNLAIWSATLHAAVSVRQRLNDAEMALGPMNEARTIADGPRGDQGVLDELTGLANRVAARHWLDARLGDETGNGNKTACLLFGISQFANINEAYGIGAGDAVLARVAARIVRIAKKLLGPDALVARMGGTEYLVAFAGEDVAPRDVARQMLNGISRPFAAEEKVIRLTARCGFAVAVPGDDSARLLRRTSAALLDARASNAGDIVERSGKRRSGRAQDDDMDRLDADLRLALDAGDIGIVYQPQYDSATDQLVGVEALARWNHPTLGQLDAGTLFDAADRSDYLIPLSHHIQKTALMEAGRWPASLAGLRLSINVTAADLAQEQFATDLWAMISESGFPHDRITVEITETGLVENIACAAELLQQLRRSELRVAIDDFGTGYSSLGYLKALHPDYLKIDHSLSRDILGTPRDRIILRAIIAMARSLAMKVIAEGVESEEQLRLLAREGCDVYQGFLRSPAVTSEELIRLVESEG